MLYVPLDGGPADSAEHRRAASRTDVGPSVGQPHRPAAVGDDLVQPEPGFALGDAVDGDPGDRRRDAARRRSRPRFQGTAQAFQDSLQGLGLILLMAIVVIYIVLGILYESFTHPLTILSGLPSAGFGALLTLLLFKTELSLYAFVGIIMLVGLVKKNGIMMVDFAVEAQREHGKTPREAIHEACLVRFRPDHDDHDGGAGRHAADRARLRRRRRSAAPARPGRRRRTARVAAADALHHAGVLRLHRERAAVAGRAASRAGRAAHAGHPGRRDVHAAAAEASHP